MYSFLLNNLPDKINLDKGSYAIYITGGHFVRIEPDFKVKILNKTTSIPIELKELVFKTRTYRNKEKAIKLYSFEVKSASTYEISIASPENIIIRENMLAETPSVFRAMNKFLFPKKYKAKHLSEIRLVIELR